MRVKWLGVVALNNPSHDGAGNIAPRCRYRLPFVATFALRAPTYYLTAEHINNSSQVLRAFVSSHIGDVTTQKLVKCPMA